MMKLFTVLAAAIIAIVGCSLDPWGLIVSSDVDARYDDGQALSAPTNLSFTPPFNFIVIADTHVKDSASATRLSNLAPKLNLQDKFIVVCGDLVQNGLQPDVISFTNTMTLLANGRPWYAVPGNHDLYNGGWTNHRTHIGRSMFTFSTGTLRVIGLDSANGTLGAKQKNWLEQTLGSHTEANCIIFTHFEFFSPKTDELQQYTNPDEIYYLMRLSEQHGVSHFFSGHSHVDASTAINGVNYVTVANHPASYLRVSVTAAGVSYSLLH